MYRMQPGLDHSALIFTRAFFDKELRSWQDGELPFETTARSKLGVFPLVKLF